MDDSKILDSGVGVLMRGRDNADKLPISLNDFGRMGKAWSCSLLDPLMYSLPLIRVNSFHFVPFGSTFEIHFDRFWNNCKVYKWGGGQYTRGGTDSIQEWRADSIYDGGLTVLGGKDEQYIRGRYP